MKVAQVEVIPLSYMKRVPPVRRSFALVRVRSDTGVVGYGEASDCYGYQTPLVVKAIVEEELWRYVVGEDPEEITRIVSKMRGYVGRFLGYRGPVIHAISGIEIALWDLVGKARSESIARLLGGAVRDRVPLYAGGTIGFDHPPEWQVEFFRPHLQRGFRALKVRVGRDPEWDLAAVRTLRARVGGRVALLVDAASNYTVETAIRMAEAFEASGVLFLEEPVPEYDLEGMAAVAAAARLPIAYGEHVSTVYGFRELIAHRAADVFQPDACVCGGLLEAQKICRLAEAAGIPVSPHCGGLTAVGIAANLHLSATLPEVMFLEYDGASDEEQPLRDELLATPILSLDRVEAGSLRVPAGPGLGVEVDESVFARYPYVPRGPEATMPVYGTPHL